MSNRLVSAEAAGLLAALATLLLSAEIATATLVAGAPTTIPAASFGGWDSERQRLEAAQFFEVFRG